MLPKAASFYAVKANPAPSILERLSAAGAGFDAAGIPEIEVCLAAGAAPDQISYSNTIKKHADTARAYDLAIRFFAFDSAKNLAKLAAAAPGSKVFCWLAVESDRARWPLDRNFGSCTNRTRKLLMAAPEIGLIPYGLSFHVGSQQCSLAPWAKAISRSAEIFHVLAAHA